MAVGTKKQIAQKEIESLRRKAFEFSRQKALKKNREDVKAAVVQALGWKSLEPFAEDMLNTALSGGFVDVNALIADLKAWQEEQKEGVENGDNEV